MKTEYTLRKSKIRSTGLRKYDLLSRLTDMPVETGEPCEKTWLIEDLVAPLNEDDGVQEQEFLLRDALEALNNSPSAARMIQEAIQYGWRISVDDLGEQDFHLDVPQKKVTLHDQGLSFNTLQSSVYFLNALKISLVRGLRDIWQEIRHGSFDEEYNPEYVLLLERVRAADLDVLSVLVAWELRAEGQFDLWRYMIGGDEGDMAMVYSSHLERDPASQFNGQALAAAFSQWFRDDVRVNACDHETLEYMDGVLAEFPVGNPFGKRKPTKIGVEILSCLPDKTPYLRDIGDEILGNPLYSGMNNEINQSHFLQVIRDCEVTYIGGVPFRDTMLAEKIFPEDFELTGSETIH